MVCLSNQCTTLISIHYGADISSSDALRRRFIVNDNNKHYAYFINKVKREIVVIVEALSFVYTSDSSGEWSCLHTVIFLECDVRLHAPM